MTTPPIEQPDLEVRWDRRTLRDTYADPAAARERVETLRGDVRGAQDIVAELVARGDLVTVLRRLDDLEDALREADAAVDRAEIAGNLPQQHTARVRLAQVRTRRGEFAESNVHVTELLAAAAQFGPVIEAFTHQHAGENDVAQAHWDDARAHFERARTITAGLELEDERFAAQRGLDVVGMHTGAEGP